MARTRYSSLALLALLLLAVPAAPGAAGPGVPLAPTIQITYPAGSTPIGEGDDYATARWGDPWDMDSKADVYFWGNPVCGGPWPQYTSVRVENGVWSGQLATTAPPLFLLQPGYRTGAIPMGRDGLYQPIDAGRYYRLTFRMKLDYVPPGSSELARIRYGDGSFENQADPAHWSWSQRFKIYADNQWHIYSLDLRTLTPGEGTLAWTAGKWMTALAIVPEMGAGATLSLDWARLSHDGIGQDVRWTGSYAGNATIQLGLGNAADGFVPVHVFEPGNWTGTHMLPATIPAAPGTTTLRGGLAEAGYTVRAAVTDATGTTTSAPAGPYTVRGAAWGTFLRPSFTAGTDWATSYAGNPWDMDTATAADFLVPGHNVPWWEFVNLGGAEVFHGLAVDPQPVCAAYADPQLQLRMFGGTIDSARFHWMTLIMAVEGATDLAAGSMARVSWWDESWTQCGISNDIILREGWNSYSIDLAGDVLEPGGACSRPWLSGNWRHFRVDPVEIPGQVSFWIDHLYIAEDVKAHTSTQLVWQQRLAAGASATLNLYYDGDRNPANGMTLIATGLSGAAGSAQAARSPLACPLQYCGYLPYVSGGLLPTFCAGGLCSYVWNTSALPEGAYYVYVESLDGYSTVGRYSDTPVIVDHTP